MIRLSIKPNLLACTLIQNLIDVDNPFDFVCYYRRNRFLFKFTGKEEEINLLGDGSEKPEFKEWSWMFPEQVLELVHKPYCTIILFLVFDDFHIFGGSVLFLPNLLKPFLEQAVDFKRPVYEQVLKVFSPYFLVDSDEGKCSGINMRWLQNFLQQRYLLPFLKRVYASKVDPVDMRSDVSIGWRPSSEFEYLYLSIWFVCFYLIFW